MAVIDDMAEDWAHGFVAEAFDQTLSPLERLDYLSIWWMPPTTGKRRPPTWRAACPAACSAI
jgi:hypothetical protein